MTSDPTPAPLSAQPYLPYEPPAVGATPGVAPAAPPEVPGPRRSRRPVALVAATAVVAGLVGGGAGAFAVTRTQHDAPVLGGTTPTPSAVQASVDGSVESVAAAVLPSTVQIQVRSSDGSGDTGSGSIISADGYILTNNHVVASAAQGASITVLFNDGRRATAQLVGRDAGADVAVIKVDGVSGLTPIKIGRSSDLKIGQTVIAVGSPLALAGTVTEGIVSAVNRPVTTSGDGSDTSVMNAIQTDSAINPGNSGGPLVDLAGELVGMNSAGASLGASQGQQTGSIGLGFAIPADQAMRIANEIIRTGHATRAVLGASAADADNGGATLQDIQDGSAAQQAGLVAGDVVTHVNGEVIDNAEALVAAIRTAAPGSTVELAVVHDGTTRTVNVTLGSVDA
jgi:putative serine protease PepD